MIFDKQKLYAFKHSPEIPLRYVGINSGGGNWYKFVKANDPDHVIYCEICAADFCLIKEL